MARQRLAEHLVALRQLSVPPDHRQRIVRLRQTHRPHLAHPFDEKDRLEATFTFELHRRTRFNRDFVSHRSLDTRAHHRLAGSREPHQPRRQIHLIAQNPVSAATRAAIRAAAHNALAQPNLEWRQGTRGTRLVMQCQRGQHGPMRVILVGHRRTERATEVAAFIANNDLEQGAVIARQHPLHRTDERIEARFRVGLVIVVNPDETHEHRHSGAQFRQKQALPGQFSRIDGWQEPRAQHRNAEEARRQGGPRGGGRGCKQFKQRRKAFAQFGIFAPRARHRRSAQRRDTRRIKHHLPRHRVMLRRRHAGQRRPRQQV